MPLENTCYHFAKSWTIPALYTLMSVVDMIGFFLARHIKIYAHICKHHKRKINSKTYKNKNMGNWLKILIFFWITQSPQGYENWYMVG